MKLIHDLKINVLSANLLIIETFKAIREHYITKKAKEQAELQILRDRIAEARILSAEAQYNKDYIKRHGKSLDISKNAQKAFKLGINSIMKIGDELQKISDKYPNLGKNAK